MGVEIVGDKVPPGHRGIGLDRALDMVYTIFLRKSSAFLFG